MKNNQRIVNKPWGQEIIWAEAEKYVGKILNIHNNSRLSKQYHEVKDETIIVLSGKLTLQISKRETFTVSDNNKKPKKISSIIVDQEIILYPGQSYHISPGTIHRFIATETDVSLMEVSTTELDDVIRLEDDFDRKTRDS